MVLWQTRWGSRVLTVLTSLAGSWMLALPAWAKTLPVTARPSVVIGGLYASGLSTDRIEQVISSLDPARVALDQLDRLELPQRARAEQRH